MKQSQPSPIWDAVNIDLFLHVADLSVFNPLFSMWMPLIILGQGQSTASVPYIASLVYFILTLTYFLTSWSSVVWINKVWRSNHARVLCFFGGPTIDWEKQIVLITGGSSGIGNSIASTLGVMGVTVVVLDLIKREAEWDDVYYFVCDLSDPVAITKCLKTVREEVGHPTILINNAGVVHGKSLVDLSIEDLNETFNVNVISQFALIKELLPNMLLNESGHIQGHGGLSIRPIWTDYSASMHALIGLHESLRLELKYQFGDPPIRTTLVVPGRVRTPLFAALPSAPSFVSFLLPTLNPHEIAKKVVAALETEQSREIYLPRLGGWLWITKGLPTWALDGLVWVSGANETTQGYVGPKAGKDD